MKYTIPLFMLLLMSSFALADVSVTDSTTGNLMTVYCDGSSGTNTFNEGEDVCIYGVGFDANIDVDVVLEDSNGFVETSAQDTNNNGIISLRSIWSNLAAGVYNFFADFNGNDTQDGDENSHSLIVIGDQPDDDDNTGDAEVPEFGTVAAIFTLIGAGLFIYKKRNEVQ